MDIEKINGKTVKISPRSITIKDEEGKTRGVISAISWANVPPREKFAFAKNPVIQKIRNSKLASCCTENLYLCGKAWVYIHDLRWDENYHRYFESFEHETAIYNERQEILRIASENGIAVQARILH